MTAERPLNVRVAEALGWTDFVLRPTQNVGRANFDAAFPSTKAEEVWFGVPPLDHAPSECVYLYDGEPCTCDADRVARPQDFQNRVPPYGEDSPEGWACTGPLVSKHCQEIIIRDWRMVSSRPDFRDGVCDKRGEFQAYPPGDPIEGWGDTIPAAIAGLILVLAEAGRLPK